MVYNETTKKNIMKYLKEHTDDVRLRVPKGTKESWRSYAEERGMSMTHFVYTEINRIIAEGKADEEENKHSKRPTKKRE